MIGAVRSGIGAAKLAQKKGAQVFVSDSADEIKISENIAVLKTLGIGYECGGHSDKVFDCDFMITSPGVPSDSEVLKKAAEQGIEVISELEFASRFCKAKIIGITGTNGKTTTTSLCEFTLNKCGINAKSAGNIGLAFSEIADDLTENDFAVVEISSFQLDHVKDFKPFISVILNITPDHLDRYEHDVNKYTASKLKIAAKQDSGDYFIFNADDKGTPEIGNETVNKFSFSIKNRIAEGTFSESGKMFFAKKNTSEEIMDAGKLSIKGEHNLANALAVLAIAKLCGCGNKGIVEAFSTFPGVEHRLEFVRELKGVKYINDSKATNVDSVWYALRSFSEPLFLILGGKDKGNNYTQIEKEVRERVRKIYAIGSSAQKVYDFFSESVEVEKVESLKSCVEKAETETKKGDVVLLSPACASFDMFKNYEDRGTQFKEIVMGLN